MKSAAWEDIKHWIAEAVVPEIDELLEEPGELSARHTSVENAALLQWIAGHFVPADPATLEYTDGSGGATKEGGGGDGGMDIVKIEEVEDATTFTIYQVAGCSLSLMRDGRVPSIGHKLAEDIKKFRNIVTEKTNPKKTDLNPSAADVLFRIQRALSEVREDGSSKQVTFVIAPIAMRRVEALQLAAVDSLRGEASAVWSAEESRVVWAIDEPLTLDRLFDLHLKTPTSALPDAFTLRAVGEVAVGHAQQGPLLCFIRASDLLDLYDVHKAALFDSNLRFYLGKKTDVNTKILQALQTVRGIRWFHVYNNGIVFTCSSFRRGKGSPVPIHLTKPQVINGGQTVVTLAEERRRLVRAGDRLSDKEQQARDAIQEELLLPAKVVVETSPERIDTIAIASNTQNALSERTLRSTAQESRYLKKVLAAGTRPWFLETKDGEWPALVAEKKALMQSVTGNKTERDFRYGPGTRVRRLGNQDAGVALLAFRGFCAEAKPSRVFKNQYFHKTYGCNVLDGKWATQARAPASWAELETAGILAEVFPGPHAVMLAYLWWSFWRYWTLSDTQQEVRAFEEKAVRDPTFERFKDGTKWNVSEADARALKDEADCVYWVERGLKSYYLVLVYQSMRVLVRRYGELSEEVSRRILQLPQLSYVYEGHPVTELAEFRDHTVFDGPVFAIAHMLRSAVKAVVMGYEPEFRKILSPQQAMLERKWVQRLSDKVDVVYDRMTVANWAQANEVTGKRVDVISDIAQILPDLGA
jgi:hypothetical protein